MNSENEEMIKPAQKELKQYIIKNNVIRVKIQFHDKKRIMLVPASYTLVQLQASLRRLYSIEPTEGLFMFVQNKQIIEGKTTIGNIKQIMGKGDQILNIKVILAEKF